MDLLKVMMELGIQYYLEVKNMILFTAGVKSGSTHIICHNYAKIKVYSYDSSGLFIFASRKNIDFA